MRSVKSRRVTATYTGPAHVGQFGDLLLNRDEPVEVDEGVARALAAHEEVRVDGLGAEATDPPAGRPNGTGEDANPDPPEVP